MSRRSLLTFNDMVARSEARGVPARMWSESPIPGDPRAALMWDGEPAGVTPTVPDDVWATVQRVAVWGDVNRLATPQVGAGSGYDGLAPPPWGHAEQLDVEAWRSQRGRQVLVSLMTRAGGDVWPGLFTLSGSVVSPSGVSGVLSVRDGVNDGRGTAWLDRFAELTGLLLSQADAHGQWQVAVQATPTSGAGRAWSWQDTVTTVYVPYLASLLALPETSLLVRPTRRARYGSATGPTYVFPAAYGDGVEWGVWWCRDVDTDVTVAAGDAEFSMIAHAGYNTSVARIGFWWAWTTRQGADHTILTAPFTVSYRYDPGISPGTSPPVVVPDLALPELVWRQLGATRFWGFENALPDWYRRLLSEPVP